jgi:hypothetical protein
LKNRRTAEQADFQILPDNAFNYAKAKNALILFTARLLLNNIYGCISKRIYRYFSTMIFSAQPFTIGIIMSFMSAIAAIVSRSLRIDR